MIKICRRAMLLTIILNGANLRRCWLQQLNLLRLRRLRYLRGQRHILQLSAVNRKDTNWTANSSGCCCCCWCTYSKAALTCCACWATSPPILLDNARYSLSDPETISSKPAILMLLQTLTEAGAVAVAVAGAGGGGGGGDGVGSGLATALWRTSTSCAAAAAGGAAISVCSKRSTSVSKRSQILSKCSTAAVGFVSVSLSVWGGRW